MSEISIYDSYVIKSILSVNEFGITAVRNLESLKCIYFSRDVYLIMKELILNGNIQAIKNFLENNDEKSFGEYLDILKFSDQCEHTYIATVYDSNEMWQDPQIIEIFPGIL